MLSSSEVSSGSLTSEHPARERASRLAQAGSVLLATLAGCSAGQQQCGLASGARQTDAGGASHSVVAPDAGTPEAPAPVSPPPTRAPSPELQVTAFDCRKLDGNVPRATGACGAAPAAAGAAGIRAWNGGGPEGSTWNAEGLACDAAIQLGCLGTLEIMLKVGSRELTRVSLQPAGEALHCSFRLPGPAWRAELDRDTDLPFRTGIFRVEAYLVCTEPVAVFRAADHFVSGFAWGE